MIIERLRTYLNKRANELPGYLQIEIWYQGKLHFVTFSTNKEDAILEKQSTVRVSGDLTIRASIFPDHNAESWYLKLNSSKRWWD